MLPLSPLVAIYLGMCYSDWLQFHDHAKILMTVDTQKLCFTVLISLSSNLSPKEYGRANFCVNGK